jgi:adenylate kinase family enzyme
MRVVVIGTSGCGKTTLAQRIAARLELPHIELDAINWQPDDPNEFVRRVTAAIAIDGWVVDGNYGPIRDLVWRRATHLVWLDYQRHVIMRRVIRRSLWRVILRTPLWAGNREQWRLLLRPSHPIRWAWSTWARRRQDTEQRLADDRYAGLVILRLRHPEQADGAIETLARSVHAA